MKTNLCVLTVLALTLPLMALKAAPDRYVMESYPDVVNSNSITVTLTAYGEAPERMAVYASKGDWGDLSTQFDNPHDHARWIPFQTNLVVDLEPGDGKRHLDFAYLYKGQTHCDGSSGAGTEVRTKLPTIAISSPPEGVTSQPAVELKGYASEQAENIKYQRFNQAGQLAGNGEFFLTDHSEHASYFTCYDVALDPGTNTFIVSADDHAGNHFSCKHVLVFNLAQDTTPPALKLEWPADGTIISGSEFDINGRCDDPTAEITALVCDELGNVTQQKGSVGRDSLGNYGGFIVERVPLSAGIEYITVVATDAANNSSLTNLTIGKSDYVLYMDPIANPHELWTRRISRVTGYYSGPNHQVIVNGVKAEMKSDGHWEAKNVPNDVSNSSFSMSVDEADDRLTPAHVWQPTVFGEPTNLLSAGLFLMAVSTNEYNHYRVDLGLTNVSGQNIPNLTWMLPKEDARYVINLFSNKEIAKQEWNGKTGQPLATNLNIHHLGKNEVAQIGGILPFPTNAAVRLASLNLDHYFQIPPPGDYRLKVTERLYQIAPDGRLVPVEFPAVTTTIKIIDQPSEMFFYLNGLQRQGKLVWGAERYGLRIGVAHGLNESRGKEANPVEIFLQSTGTNDYRNWTLRQPKAEEQFDVTLYDASGKEVPKTALGMKQGQPLSLEGQNPRNATGLFGSGSSRRGGGLRPVFVSAKDATECGHFNLNDYFEIKTPGQYRLTYQQRFYRMNTNAILTGVIMPLVTVPITINNVPGH